MPTKDINVVTLAGRLTRDMEVRATRSGFPIGNFSIACNGLHKGADGNYEKVPNFFDCVVTGQRAEGLSKMLTKGKQVFLTGALRQETWEKDGAKRSKVSIYVDTINIVSDGKREQQAENPQVDYYNPPREYVDQAPF
mgnify:FL=1